MFQSARLKLTTWYLVIIMLVSITFSFAFYRAATIEIDRVIVRIRVFEQQSRQLFLIAQPNPVITLDQLEDVKRRLQLSLIIVNGIIFVLAGGAGYFLAGRTLRPIQEMVDEQNQFISDASHELRTPIATLRAEMEASLLEKHLSDKEARKLIASNLEELGKLQELTNSLLQLAINKKKTPFSEVVFLHDVIQTAYKKIAPSARKKQITFVINQIDGKIKGDKHSITEVFVNLFDNAIKYSNAKTQVLVASKIKKHSVAISVTDEGLGIASEDLEHIFDRCYRADKSRSKADGYGLGLSIAKKIVTAHDGSFDVESELHNGTTFTLSFPLVS
jgi:two-component system sensor histidine kinase CiaH